MPRIDTSISSLDLGGMMPRSADLINYDDLDYLVGTTVTPAQLHFGVSSSMQQFGSPTSPFGPYSTAADSTYYLVDDEDDNNFDWMMAGGSMMPDPIDQSSPGAFSNGSGGGDGTGVPLNDVWHSNSMNGNRNSVSFTEFRTPIYSGTPPSGTVPYNH